MVIERLRELTDLPFEAHLMISDPARYADDYLKAGCNLLTFHLEAVPEPRPLIEHIHSKGACAGLAINPKTPVEQLEPLLNAADLFLVMSVEPGFGGQKFIPVGVGQTALASARGCRVRRCCRSTVGSNTRRSPKRPKRGPPYLWSEAPFSTGRASTEAITARPFRN